jgi:hypothetical protein
MEPMLPYPQHLIDESGHKNTKDFTNVYQQPNANIQGGGTQVFDDSQLKSKPKQTRKNKQVKIEGGGYLTHTPKRGTFEPKSYSELLHRSNELFQKRHHILARLSCNGVYDEIREDDVDLIDLMQDTLNQPDLLYKETSKAVVQS